MSKERILKTKSFSFAVRIINLYKYLKNATANMLCHNSVLDQEHLLEI